ncbi:hypothetical protein DPMN_097129 [Dreissena polymorpha]|uniref:Uncharacterized protein n=1 Tax=Dreissena polymorpha TaxID=45954 RepID=A0A9D4LB69_DREPO|nr:hypothetical protein DPMN_097129 [Dreissena polymorpha]
MNNIVMAWKSSFMGNSTCDLDLGDIGVLFSHDTPSHDGEQMYQVILKSNKKPSETGDAPQRFYLSQYCTIYSDKRKRLEGHNFGQNNTMDGLAT